MPSNDSSRTEATVTQTQRFSTWVLFSVASGAFAALNGAFAKFTTADKTSSLAHGIIPGPSAAATALETALRAGFFGLNLACNAMMWALFTRALAAASSTVRVSVLNTTANFLVTAVLGWMWFDENIGGLWWIGAAGLAGGAAIVGQSRDDEPKVQLESDYHGPEESSLSPIKATSSGEEGSDALLGDMHAGDSDEDNPPSDRRPI